MAKTISFPTYVAETVDGENIAGPATDCQRMMIAAQTYESFGGAPCRVRYLGTLSATEARVFQGDEYPEGFDTDPSSPGFTGDRAGS